MKLLSDKPYKIRLSKECESAFKYLQLHKLNPCDYLRQGGEPLVIEKAREFKFKERREREYGQNVPGWVF